MINLENPILAKLYRAFLDKKVWLEFWGLPIEYNTLAASAVGAQGQVTIDQNTDFVLLQLALTAYTAAGTVLANPDYTLDLRELSGNSNFTSQEMHVANWTGTMRNSGAIIYDLPFPRYISGNNTIQSRLTNRTATAARVDIALLGLRVNYQSTTRESVLGW